MVLLPFNREVLAPALVVGHHHASSSRSMTSVESDGTDRERILSGATSTRRAPRGTITRTLVRTVSLPNCHSFTATPRRVRSMASNVVNASAPEGQTVAHMG